MSMRVLLQNVGDVNLKKTKISRDVEFNMGY
jgi:hypothetical protein